MDLNSLLADHRRLCQAWAAAHQHAIREEQIVGLIQSDLRNYRLVYGLEQAGLVLDFFHTNLNEVILPLMGFSDAQPENDRLHQCYIDQLERHMELPLREFASQLPSLAKKMYEALLEFGIAHQ